MPTEYQTEIVEAILERKREGRTDDELIRVLVDRGFHAAKAQELITHIVASALIDYRTTIRRARKFESIFEILRVMRETSPQTSDIAEIPAMPTSSDFLERYYSQNQPLIIRGFTSCWPEVAQWTPNSILERCRDAEIEVMTGRSTTNDYERDRDKHRTRMKLADYIERVIQDTTGNDSYITAHNSCLFVPGLHPLLADLKPIPGIISDQFCSKNVNMWFGPSGTVTPMHHDTKNVLLVQVYGKKKVKLIPATQAHLVYNKYSVYSEVDPEMPDYEAFPRFADATMYDVILNPGDALFIPIFWWHHVRSLTVSISLSLSSFVYLNKIPTYDV